MQVFSNVFYLAFCSPRAFLYFPLRKAASCSKYTYCHSRKLEFLYNLGSDNNLLLFWAYQFISLLNLTNPATTVSYHSSLTIIFSSVRYYYGLFKFKIDCSICSFSDFCLIMANCCGVLAAFDQHLILGPNIALHWSADLYSVIS